VSSPSIEFQKTTGILKFRYLSLYLGMETVSCRLDKDEKKEKEKVGPLFSSFNALPANLDKKKLLWFVPPDEIC